MAAGAAAEAAEAAAAAEGGESGDGSAVATPLLARRDRRLERVGLPSAAWLDLVRLRSTKKAKGRVEAAWAIEPHLAPVRGLLYSCELTIYGWVHLCLLLVHLSILQWTS